MFRSIVILFASLTIASSAARGQTAEEPLAPELSGLGTWHVPVTTSIPRAQRFFDQGMRLLYAFNHAEAIRAFREATRLDPQLAMAYWGEALALGPNLNAPMTKESGRQAYTAVRKAMSRLPGVSPRERALIEALAARYAADGAGDRGALNEAYAAAMRQVAARFQDDADVQTLFADAQMNTMPWDYWRKDGSAKPETSRVLEALERTIARNPVHAGALHYHIHLLEASNDPDRALASADRLGTLMPAAGHMVHMPAHIYIRVGRYADAAEANERAILADEDYLAQCQAQGLYPISYYPHNLHFLWAAATLEGRRAVAVAAAHKVAAKVPHHHAGAVAWTADFPVTPMLAHARFGLWQEVLIEPRPPLNQPYAIGVWHYARGLAFIARGQLDRASAELAALKEAMTHEAFTTTLKELPLLTNLQLASRTVEGELLAARGDADAAVRVLSEAVRIEDALPYSEPPLWHQPLRQVLGAVLSEAGRAAEAETVYREDLKVFRENGWSLFGLARSLKAQGRDREAADVTRRFEKAWARADITLTSSRILRETAKAPPAGRPAHGDHGRTGHRTAVEQKVALHDGTALAYVEQGDPDGVPVILLHGYTDSWRSYEIVLPHLPPSLRALAVTQRGHGTSAKPQQGYRPEDFARDVAGFMDAVGVKRAVVVGHSMGSVVAQRFAADYPDRVMALVLEGAFLPRPANDAVREFWQEVSRLSDPIDPEFVRAFQLSAVARPLADAFLETVVGESLAVPARVWKAALAPYLEFDFEAAVRKIAVPTLIVWGAHDAFSGRGEQDALTSTIGGSRLVIYEESGHSPHWEEPRRYAADITAFIATLAVP
jgi:pimeloyl-ACP methyl ester carboxylesterase/Flp pilus assembly protein TadD